MTMKVWNMMQAKYTVRRNLVIPCIVTNHHISEDEVLVWQVHVQMQSDPWSRCQLSDEPSVQIAWKHSRVGLDDVAKKLS